MSAKRVEKVRRLALRERRTVAGNGGESAHTTIYCPTRQQTMALRIFRCSQVNHFRLL